jgi:hypothetical protein
MLPRLDACATVDHTMRTEDEFIAAIDCRFPYDDVALAQSLIDEACSISGNAAFMVAHELARPPMSCAAADSRRLELLDYLDQGHHRRAVHRLDSVQ